MVGRGLFLSLVSVALLSAPPAKAREYNIGDSADADIVSTEQMTVTDVEATAALKERESQKVPVIYRYYPHTIDQVQGAFHEAFVATRSNFLNAVEQNFHQPKLAPAEIASPDFQRFAESFQKQNVLLPVDSVLGALWAAGEPDGGVESALATRLGETMRSLIRDDVSPPDIHVGSTLRLITLADDEASTAQRVEERGSDMSKTNFVSLPRAKSGLQNSFGPDDRALGRYLASFVRPNCLLEAGLTRELRARRMDGMVVADHYEPGQVIVRRGQIVDKKIAAALSRLNQLREEAAATQARQLAAATDQARSGQTNTQWRWVLWALGGVFALLFLILWFVARSRPRGSLLPARIGREYPPDSSEEAWQRRALAAEHQVQKVQAAARAGLISYLARWWSDRTTRRLIAQRAQLADAHQTAAIEIAELEARLQKVNAPLRERLQAYERRIAELEKELTARGEENRELIKARIQIARKQLEIEREKGRMEFN